MPKSITEVSTTTEMPPKKKIDVRLPRSLIPHHYKVRLQPFINGDLTIKGYTEILMECAEAADNVTLHIADIITKNETIKLHPSDSLEGDGLTINEHVYDTEREFYIAHLDAPLEVGKNYTLIMEFEGLLNDQLRGFYRSVYTDESGVEKRLATTQFQPVDARRAFPCFDEPALKASFDVTIGRQTNMTAITNMPLMETTPIDGEEGWVWDHFENTVPMSTYLVAFVVSDFAHMNNTANDHVLFRVWARESAISQAEYAREKGPEVLTWFENYFNIPFPLPKQDMIAIPDFSAGAMENWGLITYRETALLYEPGVSAASNKQRVAVVIAHELAHQWFGDLVTPSWWTDLWLNEGFASYMEYLGTDAVEPSWQMLEQIVVDDVQDVFAIDCLESSHPISIPVGHPDEINEIFDRISYGKGASIIRMMSHFLTESTFRRGLTNYLNHYKYAAAEQDNLWEFLTSQAQADGTLDNGLTVKQVMDTWTLQMGYPVVSVMRSQDGSSATVSQERFLLVKNENSTDDHDYKWWIPLSYTTKEELDFNSTKNKLWLKDTEDQISVPGLPASDKWIIFNTQQTGYYRVNYDSNNWNLLINQLSNESHTDINTLNRAQLIDDSLDLARAGQLSYDIALEVIGYLNKEEEYVPWASALSNLAYLEQMFTRSSGYGGLKSFLLSILVPLYDKVGFEDNLEDSHLDQYKRVKAVAWTCSLDHQDCVDKSVNLLSQYMANPDNTSLISPNLKSTVYCTAIAAGGEQEWNFLWEKYLDSNVGTEKATILSSLGCSKEVWILSRYLDMAFTVDSGIRKQDSSRVFGAVARNDVGRYLAWNYLRDQWQKITDYNAGGISGFARLVKYGTGKFNTALELLELEDFKAEHAGNLGTAKRAVEQAIEKTENNIAWMDANYEIIKEWLANHGHGTTIRSS